MSRTEEFEELRPLLFSIAYRILGSESRARDAVEETRRGYERASAVPASPRAFLSAEVTRISRAARRPDPAPPTPAAAVLLLERLSPLERAVFALREIFGCGTAQIAAAVGCSEAVGRRLTAAATPFSTPGTPGTPGAPGVPGTSGGPVPSWPDRIAGADQVARVLAAIVPALLRIGVTMRPQEVDGGPGAVFHDRHGTALGALALGILDGRIQTVRWTAAPRNSGDRDTAA
ncbi:sigma factor-like helix-turn-helix DNA-binding protein [Streptomyces sp. NPDC090083]|uniref:sigma factor-like helix-turn-helix DNA-binding protein n=1 Tax=Streptomyces sp. NPDC090083 TaxID=3365941 RepID=UPI0037FF7C3B